MSDKPTYERKTPRHAPSSVYLGDKYKRSWREKKLEEIASSVGLEGRSQLIQKIADGELEVRPKASA